jgi:ATP-dependent DNA helicase RecG
LHLDLPYWNENIKILKGIGLKRSACFNNLKVHTVGELLLYKPHSYTLYNHCKQIKEVLAMMAGTPICLEGQVISNTLRRSREKKYLALESAVMGDSSGKIGVSWFVPFRRVLPKPRLSIGANYRIRGKLGYYQGKPCVINPDLEEVTKELRLLLPSYSLTKGLSKNLLTDVISQALELVNAPQGDEWTNDTQPSTIKLPDDKTILKAFRLLHQPAYLNQVEWARRTLSMVELFQWQTALALKGRVKNQNPLKGRSALSQRFLDSLPYRLTQAQNRAMAEIRGDMQGEFGMKRVLTGDVGSGKTAVIADALLAAVEMGGQAALLVPTRILAKQHYKVLQGYFNNLDVKMALLTQEQSDSPQILKEIAQQETDIVIGTHILLEEKVKFAQLLVGVIDEQHRFGVVQQQALLKGKKPIHTLTVSATPIPRTLAQSLYGTLDISILDQKPPGRKGVETFWILPDRREELYAWMAEKAQQGEQGIVICSHIDSDEVLDCPGALTTFDLLSTRFFSREEVALIHGRMDEKDQDHQIERLLERRAKVLVATSIVEVGVDIPAVSILIVESAHRFGLAQLHQLRGRAGRGDKKGYCYLISNPPTIQAKKRIQAIRTEHDGFKLAQLDLKLRGPGEFLGNRQWGLVDLNFVDLAVDQDLVEITKNWVQERN